MRRLFGAMSSRRKLLRSFSTIWYKRRLSMRFGLTHRKHTGKYYATKPLKLSRLGELQSYSLETTYSRVGFLIGVGGAYFHVRLLDRLTCASGNRTSAVSTVIFST